jgi:hypothetical protein
VKTIFMLTLMVMSTGALAARPCSETTDADRAAELVRHCRMVSQATEPSCLATNPCYILSEQIKRSCDERRLNQVRMPDFCTINR